jgi:hypothetical protein
VNSLCSIMPRSAASSLFTFRRRSTSSPAMFRWSLEGGVSTVRSTTLCWVEWCEDPVRPRPGTAAPSPNPAGRELLHHVLNFDQSTPAWKPPWQWPTGQWLWVDSVSGVFSCFHFNSIQ